VLPITFNKNTVLGLFTTFVLLTVTNECIYGKSIWTIRASTYSEYFSKNIFIVGSKMYEEIGLVHGYPATIVPLLPIRVLLYVTPTVSRWRHWLSRNRTNHNGVCSNLVADQFVFSIFVLLFSFSVMSIILLFMQWPSARLTVLVFH